MRRLVDLEASWIAPWGAERALGVTWRCDVHARCWVMVCFENPLGDGFPLDVSQGEKRYLRDEDTATLEDLTLIGPIRARCWSGYLRWGRVFTEN